MSKIKINKMVFAMGGLTVLSVGLFGYQNIVLTNQNKESIIYVAKTDINANTKLTKDMFTAVSIPEKGILPEYVLNLSQIEGMTLKGGLFKSEPITTGRIADGNAEAPPLELKLDSDVSVPLTDNDYINVYVILTSKDNKVEVKKLFNSKQIHKTINQSSNGNTDEQSVISVRVTENEIKDYYDAKTRGQIIVVRNNNIDGKEEVTNEAYDSQSQEAKNAIKPTDKKDGEISVVTTKVEEGDTIESLSLKYKTDSDTISKLNNGKVEFNVGDDIVLPAN